jgi:hypothetical protein
MNDRAYSALTTTCLLAGLGAAVVGQISPSWVYGSAAVAVCSAVVAMTAYFAKHSDFGQRFRSQAPLASQAQVVIAEADSLGVADGMIVTADVFPPDASLPRRHLATEVNAVRLAISGGLFEPHGLGYKNDYLQKLRAHYLHRYYVSDSTLDTMNTWRQLIEYREAKATGADVYPRKVPRSRGAFIGDEEQQKSSEVVIGNVAITVEADGGVSVRQGSRNGETLREQLIRRAAEHLDYGISSKAGAN